jgi:hypothetical protein
MGNVKYDNYADELASGIPMLSYLIIQGYKYAFEFWDQGSPFDPLFFLEVYEGLISYPENQHILDYWYAAMYYANTAGECDHAERV